MKVFTIGLIFFFFGSVTSPVHAQLLGEVQCAEAFNIRTGEFSDCAGIVLPEEWAKDLILIRDVELPACLARVRSINKESEIRLDSCNNERLALAQALRSTTEITEIQEPVQAPVVWYMQPTLWFAVGVVLGASSVGAAITR